MYFEVLHKVRSRSCAVLLGLCGVVLVWGGVIASLSVERDEALQFATQNTENLARAFSENVVRTISAMDQAISALRNSYQRDPGGFDINEWAASTRALTEMTTQFALVDRNGMIISGTSTPAHAVMDLSDRPHFEVLRDSLDDELFIGQPTTGRATLKPIIVLARKLVGPDGGFEGIAFVSLDPEYLSHFYETVDLGTAGTVWLAGTDGVIRASGGRRPAASSSPAGLAAAGQRLVHLAVQRSGNFTLVSPPDGLTRIYAYEHVRGYPLVVCVGIDTDVALARYFTNRTAQVALGATVTALISAVLATYLRHDGHLRRTRDDLQARYTEKSGLLETTLENISQGIMMVGPDDHVQIYNRRYLQKFGLPEDFMAAKPLVAEVARWLWDHGEYDGQGGTFEAWLRRFTESLRDEFQVVQHVRPNGVVLEIHSRVLPDGGVVRTYSDITALRAATDAAQESNRAKSTFLATMSHEIRSPLSGMMGVLDLLRTTALDSEQTGMANMVHDSAQMLLAVLNDVLDFSKIDAGALSIVPEPTALRTLLDDLVQPYVVTGRNKGIDVSLSIDEAVPAAIMTDALRLHQIVGNLLSNAMKFTPAGQVAVRVELTDDQTPWLRVLVRDSGIGMDVDTLARLFRPFVQADGSTTRKYGGSGLGLCICEQLTRLLGGRLSVTSRPGAGSEFLLELPVSACAAPPDAASETAAAGPAIRAGGRVLLVDDDPTNRWLGRRRLEQSGLDVDIAEDGQAGLEAALATSYDLIVTDLHMPRLDGVGLAHAVRAAADPALRGIPIVALSADTTAVQRKRCDDAGITEVAIKPLTTPALLALLARVLPRGEAAIAMAAAPVMVADDLENVPFDPQIYLSFMAPGDPEGAAWLGEYLAGAQDDVDELGAMLADQGADRVSVARVAHRLAGASFSAGAMTVGRAARSVELAAPDAEAVTLRERHAELCAALAAASCAIEAFRTQTEA